MLEGDTKQKEIVVTTATNNLSVAAQSFRDLGGKFGLQCLEEFKGAWGEFFLSEHFCVVPG